MCTCKCANLNVQMQIYKCICANTNVQIQMCNYKCTNTNQCIYKLTITDKQVIKPDSPAVIIRQRLHRTNTHSVTFSHDRSLTAANNQMNRIYTDCQWLKTILNNNNYSKQPTA